MNQENEIISGKSMFESVMNFTPFSGNGDEISNMWVKVVSRIGKNKDMTEDEKNCEISLGERIAINSHVVDLKNGVLLVEANHSGWIQYLRMYQKFIINGLNWNLPNLKIKNLAFRVAGSQAKLSETYEDSLKKAQKEMFSKIEKIENATNKNVNQEEKKADNNKDLPPEFYAMFDKLARSVEDEND